MMHEEVGFATLARLRVDLLFRGERANVLDRCPVKVNRMHFFF